MLVVLKQTGSPTHEEMKYLPLRVSSLAPIAPLMPILKSKRAEIEYQIVESKNIGREGWFIAEYYAYPRVFTIKIIEAVKRAGFKAAFTIEAGGGIVIQTDG